MYAILRSYVLTVLLSLWQKYNTSACHVTADEAFLDFADSAFLAAPLRNRPDWDHLARPHLFVLKLKLGHHDLYTTVIRISDRLQSSTIQMDANTRSSEPDNEVTGQQTAFPTYGSVQADDDGKEQSPPPVEEKKKRRLTSSIVSLSSFRDVSARLYRAKFIKKPFGQFWNQPDLFVSLVGVQEHTHLDSLYSLKLTTVVSYQEYVLLVVCAYARLVCFTFHSKLWGHHNNNMVS